MTFKEWKLESCPCRLCKTYLQNICKNLTLIHGIATCDVIIFCKIFSLFVNLKEIIINNITIIINHVSKSSYCNDGLNDFEKIIAVVLTKIRKKLDPQPQLFRCCMHDYHIFFEIPIISMKSLVFKSK